MEGLGGDTHRVARVRFVLHDRLRLAVLLKRAERNERRGLLRVSADADGDAPARARGEQRDEVEEGRVEVCSAARWVSAGGGDGGEERREGGCG